MAVHVYSKIKPWVQEFHPDFYTSLTDKEEWTYLNHELVEEELEAAEDLFQSIQDAMDSWKNSAAAPRLALKPIVMRLVTYQIYVGRGMVEATTTDEQLDAKQIFEMGGFIAATLSRPVDYYDDITEYDPLVPPYEPESLKMVADLELLDPVNWKPLEQAKVDALEALASSVVNGYNYKAMFEDIVPAGTGTPQTKIQTAEWIFNTLHYKWAKDTFPGVNLAIPPFIV